MDSPEPFRPAPIASLTPRPDPWLWPNVIRRGALTVLDGDPGVGKSLLTIDLAARLSRGLPWPDGSPGGRPGNVVLFCGEDSREDTVYPRLLAAGADMTRVFVTGTPDDPNPPPVLPGGAEDLDSWFGVIGPDLLVFDPLDLFLSGGGDVRKSLSWLVRMAAKHRTAVMPTRHLVKFLRGRAVHAGRGSVGIIGAARTGLLAARDPVDPSRYVLTATKANLAAAPGGLAYRVGEVSGQGVIEWLGPAPTTAEEAARGPRAVEGLVAAADWLLRALEAGERWSIELEAAARAAGISERTLNRAKKELGVRSRVTSAGGRREWRWVLPGAGGGGARSGKRGRSRQAARALDPGQAP